MVLDVLNHLPEPASQMLASVIQEILQIVVTSKHVTFQKDSFLELANYLERLIPLLKELSIKNVTHSDGWTNVVTTLSKQLKAAKQLLEECSKRNRVYLLVNCRSIAKRLRDITGEISRALAIIPLCTLDISSGIISDINQLCDQMKSIEFKASMEEEEIMEKIESGIQERSVDRSYANGLFLSIADALGISTDPTALKKEFVEFKKEIENAKLRKDRAEAIQMDQIIALLERADATSSPSEKELKYLSKRDSLGSQPLEPLQSFICPITRDVMVDPVETSSGQTFERSAIEKWLADGNYLCPLTMVTLDSSVLRPNKTLRQSIEEWNDRNTMISIASMKPKLSLEDEDEVFRCLEQLQSICEQKDIHREWVILENYIPVLIQLLASKNREMRRQVLSVLCVLAKDSDDSKERIARDNGIDSIVHSLGRRIPEGKLAVKLLLEVSKSESVRECIGRAQGCIFFLVTISGGEDIQAARDATELLETLSFSSQNVIQMAKTNYFKHLLKELSAGPEDVKLLMAKTLAEMELTDNNKSSLLKDGVLAPLLHLVSHGDGQMKVVAVKVLRNLSSLLENGLEMIKRGVVRPLLDLLCNHMSSSALPDEVAVTIMHLAISTASQDSSETEVSLLETDEDIYRLFSRINMPGPTVQKSLLRAFHAMCQAPCGTSVKTKLTKFPAGEVLVRLCGIEETTVRANAVKLLCCLMEDCDGMTISEHVDGKFVQTLLEIIKAPTDVEETASAMGIISNLPVSPQTTTWLLDEGALPVVYGYLSTRKHAVSHQNRLVENAVGAICHFSHSTNQISQKRAAEIGVIEALVQLLESDSTLAKEKAALSLAQFSSSSLALCRSIPRNYRFFCFSPQSETLCPVHRGSCDVESTFCLVKAGGVEPLVRVIAEQDPKSSEAALDALLTLIEGELLQNGSKVLSEANAMPPIVKLLNAPSPGLQEKVLIALERIFRLVEFKQKYGVSAHMGLVDLTQRGNRTTKPLAAKILAQLNVLHDQSSYF